MSGVVSVNPRPCPKNAYWVRVTFQSWAGGLAHRPDRHAQGPSPALMGGYAFPGSRNDGILAANARIGGQKQLPCTVAFGAYGRFFVPWFELALRSRSPSFRVGDSYPKARPSPVWLLAETLPRVSIIQNFLVILSPAPRWGVLQLCQPLARPRTRI